MLNSVFLIGNLGADPDIRATQSGDRVATFSLATSEKWKTKDGEAKESTEWHRCVVWGGLVKVVDDYLKKGDRVFVRGKIVYRTWEDEHGNKRYGTDIRVFEMKMLGSPSGKQSERRPEAPLDNFTDDALAGEDDLPF